MGPFSYSCFRRLEQYVPQTIGVLFYYSRLLCLLRNMLCGEERSVDATKEIFSLGWVNFYAGRIFSGCGRTVPFSADMQTIKLTEMFAFDVEGLYAAPLICCNAVS